MVLRSAEVYMCLEQNVVFICQLLFHVKSGVNGSHL